MRNAQLLTYALGALALSLSARSGEPKATVVTRATAVAAEPHRNPRKFTDARIAEKAKRKKARSGGRR